MYACNVLFLKLNTALSALKYGMTLKAMDLLSIKLTCVETGAMKQRQAKTRSGTLDSVLMSIKLELYHLYPEIAMN